MTTHCSSSQAAKDGVRYYEVRDHERAVDLGMAWRRKLGVIFLGVGNRCWTWRIQISMNLSNGSAFPGSTMWSRLVPRLTTVGEHMRIPLGEGGESREAHGRPGWGWVGVKARNHSGRTAWNKTQESQHLHPRGRWRVACFLTMSTRQKGHGRGSHRCVFSS